jgi:hypothetical protein
MQDADVAGGVAAVCGALEDLERMLQAGASSCQRMADAIVPPGGAMSSRYRRAAASWPSVPTPSYERFASALSALHDTEGDLRLAATQCRNARMAIEALGPRERPAHHGGCTLPRPGSDLRASPGS